MFKVFDGKKNKNRNPPLASFSHNDSARGEGGIDNGHRKYPRNYNP
jgi:hypothetical protein